MGSTTMRSKDAAKYLGYVDRTLRESRMTGILAGVTTPPYRKIGGRVEYEQSDLDKWKSQFKKINNTAQSSTYSGQ